LRPVVELDQAAGAVGDVVLLVIGERDRLRRDLADRRVGDGRDLDDLERRRQRGAHDGAGRDRSHQKAAKTHLTPNQAVSVHPVVKEIVRIEPALQRLLLLRLRGRLARPAAEQAAAVLRLLLLLIGRRRRGAVAPLLAAVGASAVVAVGIGLAVTVLAIAVGVTVAVGILLLAVLVALDARP